MAHLCLPRIPAQSRCPELGPARTLSQRFPLLRANLPPNTALMENQSLIFLSSGNQSFANKAKAVLQHSTAETELGTALLHRGMMANSDLQHPQATIQGAKAGSWGEGGSYKTVQFENRHKLQVSASKSRIQIPVLSFPALSSSLQVWKGGNAGKKWIPIHCFTKTKLQFL